MTKRKDQITIVVPAPAPDEEDEEEERRKENKMRPNHILIGSHVSMHPMPQKHRRPHRSPILLPL